MKKYSPLRNFAVGLAAGAASLISPVKAYAQEIPKDTTQATVDTIQTDTTQRHLSLLNNEALRYLYIPTSSQGTSPFLPFIPITIPVDTIQDQGVRSHPIVSDSARYSFSGNGVTLEDAYVDISLTPNSRYDLTELLGLRTRREDDINEGINYSVVKYPKALEDIISRLKMQNQNQRTQSAINYFQRQLDEIENQPSNILAESWNASYRQNLENLLEDGVLDFGTEQFPATGIYAVQVQSASERASGYVFLNITTPGNALEQLRTESTASVESSLERELKPKTGFRFFADGYKTVDEDVNAVGGALGIGFGPVAVYINHGIKDSEVIDQATVRLSQGRVGTGYVVEGDFAQYGVGAELQLGPFVLGGGVNQWNFTERTNESILASNRDVLKSNTDSRSKQRNSQEFYGGFNIPLGSHLSARLLGGHNTESGNFARIGVGFRTHRPQHRK